MRKDTRLTFRVHSSFKKELETIAAREGRSVAQICDAFLKAGSETYRKKGAKYLRRFLSRQMKEDSEYCLASFSIRPFQAIRSRCSIICEVENGRNGESNASRD